MKKIYYRAMKSAYNNAFWRGTGLKPLSVAALAGLIIIGTPAFASDNIINPHPLADLRRAMSSVSEQARISEGIVSDRTKSAANGLPEQEQIQDKAGEAIQHEQNANVRIAGAGYNPEQINTKPLLEIKDFGPPARGGHTTATGYAADIVPTLGEDSVIRFGEGTADNYNFKTTDSDGNDKYYTINLNTDKMTTVPDKVQWSDTDSGSSTGHVNVKLPYNDTTDGQTKTYYYTTNGASSARINNTLSQSITNEVFYGKNVTSFYPYGGAIYNSGSHSDVSINADFIGNYASAPPP